MTENNLRLDEVKVEEVIKHRIFIIRGHKVMLDVDLAELYGVKTKAFNQTIKRNLSRFPGDFMFKLDKDEYEELNRSQIVTGYQKHRNPRFLPYAFTEHGVAMLSSVLKNNRAVQMNIFIIRVFIKIREWILSNKDLEIKVKKIEEKQKEQGDILKTLNSTVGRLIEKPIKQKGKIGFQEKT